MKSNSRTISEVKIGRERFKSNRGRTSPTSRGDNGARIEKSNESKTGNSESGFFEKSELFGTLGAAMFPRAEKNRGASVRGWVVGCGSGQEAYSFAMALTEVFEGRRLLAKIQLFATDTDETLLRQARAGFYERAQLKKGSVERLRKFFIEENGGFRISKGLRESVVFARHDVLRDTPYSRLDLIAWRRPSIGSDELSQQNIVSTFYHALKPGGLLILGASGWKENYAELFRPVEGKPNIYVKKSPGDRRRKALYLSRSSDGAETKCDPHLKGPTQNRTASVSEAQREADRIAISRYVPPSVLINSECEVVHFSGNTTPFIKLPTGKPTFNLFRIVDSQLSGPLKTAVQKSKLEGVSVRIKSNPPQPGDRLGTVSMEVVPLKNLKGEFYLIFFAGLETGGTLAKRRDMEAPSDSKSGNFRLQIKDLKQDLTDTRDYLRAIEELNEVANEELQSSNEEITSYNEELQSINEELAASQDQLKLANAEMEQINSTLEQKVMERTAALAEANERLQEISGKLLHAQEDERARIARELHDEIGQSLTAMNLLTNQIQGDEAEARIADLREIICEVMHRVRTLSYELHPPILDSLGIRTALKWHFITFGTRTKIRVNFKGGRLPEPPLGAAAKITLFRIAQESLNNIAKHAKTSVVEAQLFVRAGSIHLKIRDRGKGFSVEKRTRLPSLGLSSMRERTKLLGGAFEIESTPGKGTQIRVSIPLATTTMDETTSPSGGNQV